MSTTYQTRYHTDPPNGKMMNEKTIVIVEDDTAIGEMLVMMLSQEAPYQPFHVTTGRQALSLVPLLHPRLLLLDYRLPDMMSRPMEVRAD